MNKRKEPETPTSSECSEVYNPEFCVKNPDMKRQKISDEVEFFNVQLNGAPFYDFFAKEDGIVSSVDDDNDESVIEADPIRMYCPGVDWTVRKVLTPSDCNAQHRLMIKKALMEGGILGQLDEESRLQVNTLEGLRVDVLDCDLGIELKLTLKRWPSSGSYGLMDNWKRDFVVRRELVPGDEVGVCWDESRRRLLFSVLKKSTVVDHGDDCVTCVS